MSIPTERLVAEALTKSGLLWIRSSAGEAPAWHATVEGIAYVLGGEGEQYLPLHDGPCHVVTRSKESRARLASFQAQAERVTPDSPDWAAATAALKAGRLNAATGDVVERWASSGVVLRLTPDLSTVVLRGQSAPAPVPHAGTPSAEAPHPELDNGTKVSG